MEAMEKILWLVVAGEEVTGAPRLVEKGEENAGPFKKEGAVPNMLPPVVPPVVPNMLPPVLPPVVPNMLPPVLPPVVPNMLPPVVPNMLPPVVPPVVPNMLPPVVPNMLPPVVPNILPPVVPNMLPPVTPVVVTDAGGGTCAPRLSILPTKGAKMLGCELLDEVKAVETVCIVLDKATAGREMGANTPVGGK